MEIRKAHRARVSLALLFIDLDHFKEINDTLGHESDPDSLALCEAIIVMAHRLGLKVIAEGVENRKQSELLRSAGCDYAQGFLFSRPVPAGQFEALLSNGTLAHADPPPPAHAPPFVRARRSILRQACARKAQGSPRSERARSQARTIESAKCSQTNGTRRGPGA